jgi:hypothetical protein
MGNNPFQVLGEELEQDSPRPTTPTPIGQANKSPLVTPEKKKAKRKATSPMPAITPIRLAKPSPKIGANRTATGYLFLARKALYAAIKAEKQELGEEYVEDNDIQIISDELEAILEQRPMEVEAGLDSLELQGQLDRLNARLDTLATEIKTQGLKTQGQQENRALEKQENRAPISQNPSKQPTQAKTFADALKGQNNPPTTIPKVTTYRERRLILQGTAEQGKKIDSMKIRDQINKAFKEKAQILTPIVGTVTRSQKNGDIVLSTTEKFDAEFLKKNEAIWKPLFTFNRAIRDTTWSKVVAHMIPTSIFNVEGGMDLLQEELQVFNGLNPITKPVWLSSPENRAKKMHGSVLLAFENKIEAEKALRNRLQIAGISVRTTEFILARPTDQCHRCQQFGHNERTCKRDPRCPICAGNHPKRLHHCHICTSRGEKCIHSKIKCSNCQGDHEATDRSCKAYKDRVARAKNPTRGKEPPL